MFAIDICPKCRRQATVAFSSDFTEKLLVCQFCGLSGSAADLNFDPDPQFLYKYRPHDNFSKSWIVNEEVFFPSPLKFNDPFDSKVAFTFDGDRKQKRKFLAQSLEISHPTMKKRERARYISECLEKASFEVSPHLMKAAEEMMAACGVLSLSTKFDDILMYSYYANNHTGYCLKYRRASENFLSIAEPVIYADAYPKLSLLDVSFYKTGDFGRTILFTKSKLWSHENEWRVTLAGGANRVAKSPQPILDSIIFGCAMTDEKRKDVIALNSQRKVPVPLWQAVKRKFDFAIDIIPISKG